MGGERIVFLFYFNKLPLLSDHEQPPPETKKKRSEVGCKVAQGFYLKIGAPIQTTHSLLLLSS